MNLQADCSAQPNDDVGFSCVGRPITSSSRNNAKGLYYQYIIYIFENIFPFTQCTLITIIGAWSRFL